MQGLTEEAPSAFKDVDAVVEIVSQASIARKVAQMRPVAKGDDIISDFKFAYYGNY